MNLHHILLMLYFPIHVILHGHLVIELSLALAVIYIFVIDRLHPLPIVKVGLWNGGDNPLVVLA